MKFFAAVVVAVMAGGIAIQQDIASSVAPPEPELAADRMGQIFLQYRSAVATYQLKNPNFTGTAPISALVALGFQFPPDSVNVAGNAITATGTNGRIVTCYGTFPAGAGPSAMRASQGDTSLGFASGSNWVSYSGGVVSPLATAVPDGAVVSVIQNGN